MLKCGRWRLTTNGGSAQNAGEAQETELVHIRHFEVFVFIVATS